MITYKYITDPGGNVPVGNVATGILLSQVCFAHKIGALGTSTGTYPAVLKHSKAEVVSTSVNHSMCKAGYVASMRNLEKSSKSGMVGIA